MSDLIYRKDVIEDYIAGFGLTIGDIEKIPAIEAEPIEHGRWRHYEGTLTCSVCHTKIYDNIMELLGDDVPKYCPDCGAKMDGGNNDSD